MMKVNSALESKNLLISSLGRFLNDYEKATKLLESCDFKLQEVLYNEVKLKEVLTDEEVMRLKNCFMLVKYSMNTYAYSVKAKSGADFFNIFKGEFIDEAVNEKFYVAYLTASGELKQVKKISEGSYYSTNVSIRKILEQVPIGTKFIILCHNHPNGILYPSSKDIEITNDIKAACARSFVVLDHIIISKDNYYSFVENNRM